MAKKIEKASRQQRECDPVFSQPGFSGVWVVEVVGGGAEGGEWGFPRNGQGLDGGGMGLCFTAA